MINVDAAECEFRKSTFSGGGNDCVEVATNVPGVVIVRDSKDPDLPALSFSYSEWRAFVKGVRAGQFDV